MTAGRHGVVWRPFDFGPGGAQLRRVAAGAQFGTSPFFFCPVLPDIRFGFRTTKVEVKYDGAKIADDVSQKCLN